MVVVGLMSSLSYGFWWVCGGGFGVWCGGSYGSGVEERKIWWIGFWVFFFLIFFCYWVWVLDFVWVLRKKCFSIFLRRYLQVHINCIDSRTLTVNLKMHFFFLFFFHEHFKNALVFIFLYYSYI